MSISTISKSIPHFLLSSLFWKLSQPLCQDQQNSKQTYCWLPIMIFLWLLRSFLSRVFLEFSPKPVYSTMVAEKFHIYSVKITANTFVNQKSFLKSYSMVMKLSKMLLQFRTRNLLQLQRSCCKRKGAVSSCFLWKLLPFIVKRF